jgi:hypothetical protein
MTPIRKETHNKGGMRNTNLAKHYNGRYYNQPSAGGKVGRRLQEGNKSVDDHITAKNDKSRTTEQVKDNGVGEMTTVKDNGVGEMTTM